MTKFLYLNVQHHDRHIKTFVSNQLMLALVFEWIHLLKQLRMHCYVGWYRFDRRVLITITWFDFSSVINTHTLHKQISSEMLHYWINAWMSDLNIKLSTWKNYSISNVPNSHTYAQMKGAFVTMGTSLGNNFCWPLITYFFGPLVTIDSIRKNYIRRILHMRIFSRIRSLYL